MNLLDEDDLGDDDEDDDDEDDLGDDDHDDDHDAIRWACEAYFKF